LIIELLGFTFFRTTLSSLWFPFLKIMLNMNWLIAFYFVSINHCEKMNSIILSFFYFSFSFSIILNFSTLGLNHLFIVFFQSSSV
jgi:hypothetical protein